MRWEALFADLAAQATALEHGARDAEIDERTRYEFGTGCVLDRLRVTAGQHIQIAGHGGFTTRGNLSGVGADWMLVAENAGREALIVLAAVSRIRGLSRRTAVPGSAGIVESRVGLRSALRRIARDRSAVHAHLRDGTVIAATVDRVGADFIEVATHAAGEPRRQREVHQAEVIPFSALVAIRRGG